MAGIGPDEDVDAASTPVFSISSMVGVKDGQPMLACCTPSDSVWRKTLSVVVSLTFDEYNMTVMYAHATIILLRLTNDDLMCHFFRLLAYILSLLLCGFKYSCHSVRMSC